MVPEPLSVSASEVEQANRRLSSFVLIFIFVHFQENKILLYLSCTFARMRSDLDLTSQHRQPHKKCKKNETNAKFYREKGTLFTKWRNKCTINVYLLLSFIVFRQPSSHLRILLKQTALGEKLCNKFRL